MKSEKSDPNLELKKRVLCRNFYAYLLISFYSGFSSFSDIATQFFFKDELKMQPGVLAQVSSITGIAWMLKPIFGLITDLVPIFGYRRKYYVILMSFIICYSFFMLSQHTKTLTEAVIFLFLTNVGASFSTVIGEATVVELTQLNQDVNKKENNANEDETDSKDLVSSYFLIKYFGAMISSLFGGRLVDTIHTRNVFLISAGLPVLILVGGCLLIDYNVEKIETSNYL